MRKLLSLSASACNAGCLRDAVLVAPSYEAVSTGRKASELWAHWDHAKSALEHWLKLLMLHFAALCAHHARMAVRTRPSTIKSHAQGLLNSVSHSTSTLYIIFRGICMSLKVALQAAKEEEKEFITSGNWRGKAGG